MSTVPTSEILNRAADLIEERGWTGAADGWDADASALCLEGGIAAATGADLQKMSHSESLVACPAYAAVWSHLLADGRWGMRKGLLERGNARLYDWNDVSGRTASEVIEVLRACAVIEASRERESAEVTR